MERNDLANGLSQTAPNAQACGGQKIPGESPPPPSGLGEVSSSEQVRRVT